MKCAQKSPWETRSASADQEIYLAPTLILSSSRSVD